MKLTRQGAIFMNKIIMIIFTLMTFNFASACPDLAGSYESLEHMKNKYQINIEHKQTKNKYTVEVYSKETGNLFFTYHFDKIGRLQTQTTTDNDGYKQTTNVHTRCELRDMVVDYVDCDKFEGEPGVTVETYEDLKICKLDKPSVQKISTLVYTETVTTENPAYHEGWFEEKTFAYNPASNFIYIKDQNLTSGNTAVIYKKVD